MHFQIVSHKQWIFYDTIHHTALRREMSSVTVIDPWYSCNFTPRQVILILRYSVANFNNLVKVTNPKISVMS